jgi:lipopolysaccharide/colanic/teichoic acid biosynthesis glycosyltransferase
MALHEDRSVRPRVSTKPLVSPRLRGHAKRMFDVVASTGALAILSPLIVVVAAAIKLESRGPIFIRETAYGYKNRPIQVLKFRTIRICGEAECSRESLLGHALLRSGIEGIPRLFNVLRGDMSIVGPRLYADPEHLVDHGIVPMLGDVKPGIATWGLDADGGLDPIQQRINADLHYAKSWSPLLDIKIIFAALLS